MVIQRIQGRNDMMSLLPVLSQEQSEGFTGAGFGIAWPLVIQIAGWVIQGVGIGMSVRDALRQGKEKANLPADQPLAPGDINSLAQQVAAVDTQKRGEAYWKSMLEQADRPAPVLPTPCKEGFVRDPETGVCIPIKAGLIDSMPTWGWVLVGLGGFWFLSQTGMLKRP